ncbi:hypothetical protein [Colwellia sp. PAMC 20917]|nr:hypothetical protein [Colwellia sp. PAMC 20917]
MPLQKVAVTVTLKQHTVIPEAAYRHTEGVYRHSDAIYRHPELVSGSRT